ncbi:MAG: hypothetical protein ASARMPREDX12_001460 [Alectoria sarmentosa]|nr:MAG: hypothetical protein ASARMPREDX12_001460 [Alectoria sarmentosa]
MAWGSHGATAFATFMILCPTCFALGILFSLFPYDYPILWNAAACPPEAYVMLERHLRFLHASPPVIPRILHAAVGTGLLGFFIKLYRPSESNMLFDGASLVLYMCGVIIYLANIVKGMRVITSGVYDRELVQGELAVGVKGVEAGAEEFLGRDDSLKVMAASNTILALVLVGVLVLQAGQWYAERKEGQQVESLKARKEKLANGESKGEERNRHKSPNSKKKV